MGKYGEINMRELHIIFKWSGAGWVIVEEFSSYSDAKQVLDTLESVNPDNQYKLINMAK